MFTLQKCERERLTRFHTHARSLANEDILMERSRTDADLVTSLEINELTSASCVSYSNDELVTTSCMNQRGNPSE